MNKLTIPPKFERLSAGKGIKADAPIDRTGGRYGAGLIRGFAVVSRGEALGHDVWCDTVFLQQAADAINARPGGRKSRFTHPGLSSDGLGKFLGRTTNASVVGDVVRADLHFASVSHRTPDGDLASYVMDFASESPECFGASIVFDHDTKAEEAFKAANGGTNFRSPDRLNTRNLPHARLSAICAVDIVDDPAANPAGLFYREQELATEAEAVLAYALGLSTQKPDAELFGVDPERLAQFLAGFLSRRGIKIAKQQTKPEWDRLAALLPERLLAFARSLGPQIAALGQTVK